MSTSAAQDWAATPRGERLHAVGAHVVKGHVHSIISGQTHRSMIGAKRKTAIAAVIPKSKQIFWSEDREYSDFGDSLSPFRDMDADTHRTQDTFRFPDHMI